MLPRALVLQLDFHKSTYFPKITSQDCYYKKRLATHLMGIYNAGKKTLHAYMYPSTIGGQGPDEVISIIDMLLRRMDNGIGHLILWADNCPGQFKECYLFFYCDWLIKNGRFWRVDLKFLLEGHTYGFCDRRFSNIEIATRRHEKIETPLHWMQVLRDTQIKNLEVHELVTLPDIKNYKSFLKDAYVSRNVDLEGNKVSVRKLAWLNFGQGEMKNDQGTHLDSIKLEEGECLMRYTLDPNEIPHKVNFKKKKQCNETDGKCHNSKEQ